MCIELEYNITNSIADILLIACTNRNVADYFRPSMRK